MYQFVATKLDEWRYPAPGKMIDIGGYRLHMLDKGICEPTVVLDSGSGCNTLDWSLVQPEIAKFTRVVSYDRAGYAWSDASPLSRTSEHIVQELHELLKRAGVPGPYILVGHSYGGVNVRLYASMFPKEVAGVILVDSSHEDQLKKFPHPNTVLTPRFLFFNSIGLIRLILHYVPGAQESIKKYPAHIRSLYCSQKCRTKSIKALMEECALLEESSKQLKQAGGLLGNKPLIVITAGKQLKQEETGGLFSQEQIAVMNTAHQEFQKDLVTKSSRGKQIIAEHSGHPIPHDQPGNYC